MAVIVGINGRPAPIYEEFDVTEADRVAIDKLVDKVAGILEGASNQRQGVILAALAEFTAKYLQGGLKSKGSAKRKAGR